MPEAVASAATGDVKVEPKEDVEEPPTKKRPRQKKGDDDAKNEVTKKKNEEDAEGDEPGNEEDAMAPEAEPTHQRNEVPAGTTKFREDAVHVYGLDFLKTGHMEEIFGQFNHKYIEWINDSSANVVFRDAPSARKALESLSYAKAGDAPWCRTPDILVHDDLPAVFLQMRLAAASDCKKSQKGVPSLTPPVFVEEGNRRNPSFTVASLYDKTPKDPKAPMPARKRGTPAALPEAEISKRSKRAERFAETLKDPPAAAEAEDSAAGKAADKSEAKVGAETKVPAQKLSPEEVAEEASRREKRAARFGSGADAETDKALEKDKETVAVEAEETAAVEAEDK